MELRHHPLFPGRHIRAASPCPNGQRGGCACSLDQSEDVSIGIVKQQKVDILGRYPDNQRITARAITIFDVFAEDTITHPVMLFFSNGRKYHETLYRLYVDCR